LKQWRELHKEEEKNCPGWFGLVDLERWGRSRLKGGTTADWEVFLAGGGRWGLA